MKSREVKLNISRYILTWIQIYGYRHIRYVFLFEPIEVFEFTLILLMNSITAKQAKVTGGLWQFVEKHKLQIERSLENNLPVAPAEIETRFNEAVWYSVFPGGKRLRPVLTLLGAELFGGKAEDVMHAAAAVELIHTSSLIFDDLPCMDDSRERRGKLSLHEEHGEGLSTLVAIGFLNHSYRLVTLDGHDPVRSVSAVLEIVDCLGPGGMVGGQSVDLMIATEAECKICARNKYGVVLNLKTSSLIRLALRLGAILSGADASGLESLSNFAEALGQAYQISDDIIDLHQDAAIFGENDHETGSGPASPSADTLYVKVEEAKKILTDNFNPCEARDHLSQLVDYVAERKV